jgi:hypothetical protein
MRHSLARGLETSAVGLTILHHGSNFGEIDMQTKPAFRRLMAFGIAFLAATAVIASPAAAAVVLTDSYSTWLSEIGVTPISTTQYGQNFSTTSSVALTGNSFQPGLGYGSIGLSSPAQILDVGNGWATWSNSYPAPAGDGNPYTGQVLYTQGLTDLTLTPNSVGSALGFQVEPNLFSPFDVTVTLSSGQTLTDTVNGNGGAQFFGYAGGEVASVKITSASDFAVGNFVQAAPGPIPGAGLLSLAFFILAGLKAKARQILASTRKAFGPQTA